MEVKIRALGWRLATGAQGDEDTVDFELLFSRAMIEIDVAQLQFLQYLQGNPRPRWHPGRPKPGISKERYEELDVRMSPMIATLERHGAINYPDVTGFGRETLRRLQDAGEGHP